MKTVPAPAKPLPAKVFASKAIAKRPIMENLETRAQSCSEQAKAIVVRDQRSYDKAAEMLLAVKALRKQVDEIHDEAIRAAHVSHLAALKAKAKADRPLQEAEIVLKVAIGDWEREQKQLQEELDRLALEAAERLEEEQRQAELKRAKAQGASKAEMRAIEEQPRPIVVPVATPTFQRARGVSTAISYACEVTNLRALCNTVAKGIQSTELVMGLERDKATGSVSSPALNKLANALRTTFAVDGCKVVERNTVSARVR